MTREADANLDSAKDSARDERFWVEELQRRIQAIDAGEPTFDADLVLRELEEEFGIAGSE